MKQSILASFAKDDIHTAERNGRIVYLNLEDLIFDENNHFSMAEDRIESLTEEIMSAGFKSVIEVRKADHGKYKVICGESRARALMKAYERTQNKEFECIPAYITELSSKEAQRRLNIDNLLAREITPAEKLVAIEKLKSYYMERKEAGEKLPDKIQHLIAEDTGLKKSQVGTYEKVLNHAVPEVRKAIEEGEITITAASELCDLEDEDQLMFVESGSEMNIKTIREFKEELQEDEEVSEAEEPSEEDVYSEEIEEEPLQLEQPSSQKSQIHETFTIPVLINMEEKILNQLLIKFSAVEFHEEKAIVEAMLQQFSNITKNLVLD